MQSTSSEMHLLHQGKSSFDQFHLLFTTTVKHQNVYLSSVLSFPTFLNVFSSYLQHFQLKFVLGEFSSILFHISCFRDGEILQVR